MLEIRDIVELVSDRLAGIADSDVVMGEPMKVGEVTIVPISRLGLGFGAGGGTGEAPGMKGRHGMAEGGKGTGGGSGCAGKVRPVAVAVFSDGGVEILPIADKKGRLDKLLEKIPDLVERFKPGHGDSDGSSS